MTATWDLRPGDDIRRKELHRRYGGSPRGGISPSAQSPNVLVFTDPNVGSEHGYIYDSDPTRPGIFHYTGEGQLGDQRMIKGNRAILEHAGKGRAIRVFHGVRGNVRYVGEFELGDPPYSIRQAHESGGPKIRDVIVFHLSRQGG